MIQFALLAIGIFAIWWFFLKNFPFFAMLVVVRAKVTYALPWVDSIRECWSQWNSPFQLMQTQIAMETHQRKGRNLSYNDYFPTKKSIIVETTWGFYRKNNSPVTQMLLLEAVKQDTTTRAAIIKGDASVGRWTLVTAIPIRAEVSTEEEELAVELEYEPDIVDAKPEVRQQSDTILESATTATTIESQQLDVQGQEEATTIVKNEEVLGEEVKIESNAPEETGKVEEEESEKLQQQNEAIPTEVDQFKSSLEYYHFNHLRWCVYRYKEKHQIAVVFPGGAGTVDDAAKHPSSPITRMLRKNSMISSICYSFFIPMFVAKASKMFLPAVDLIYSLRVAYPEDKIIVIGFSMGGLLALALANEFANESWFIECVTFNPTVSIFPKEFHDMMLINDEETVRKTTNWFVKEDPLAYGVEFLKWKYGLPFGRNNVLPAIYSVNLFRNHQLTNFITV